MQFYRIFQKKYRMSHTFLGKFSKNSIEVYEKYEFLSDILKMPVKMYIFFKIFG